MLKIEGLSKTFNQDTPLENRVIDALSLKVERKDFITLLGSNGAGKSTLLNLIAGTLEEEEGQIILDGQELTPMKAYKRANLIGRVHQDPRLSVSPNMTLLENLSLADAKGHSFSLKKAIDLNRTSYYKEQLSTLGLGLETKLHTKIGLLSGGQRQAVALFMAVMKKPKLLLLDEHTAALDPRTSEIIMGVTEKLISQEEITTLMVTHNMNHALSYGNRLIMMHEGRIVEDLRGKDKAELTAQDVIAMFKKNAEVIEDRMVLGL
ncbi:ATP-binding cassette domain-containing protein [Proteiniclasticum sp. SCR006]|uniref:ATP-binding cassette domain-containing protein n=1 Tax=Proteiniclasticum aestuarii TaxID=2817862 RepID=A0A939HAC1_9CLOT|nr:ATP-binding cassette domain-containing protein [Proteiniclasticum aestuarii]MBO1264655.1 ATP-binding cassette domain-containing protein [Proteiniclasticum aestuarii]